MQAPSFVLAYVKEGCKMGIWIDEKTKVLVQGITGKAARYHTAKMLQYGTQIVGGVSPNKKIAEVEGVKVYESVLEARKETGANASIIYVPAPYAADAIMEAVDGEMPFVVCITEHIPILDMIRVKAYMKGKKTRLLGPNCPGIIVPGACKMGIMPGEIHKKGHVGIVSRSGTLTYEAVDVLTKNNMGQSAAVGIGGDPVNGTGFIDVLAAFEQDPDTEKIVLIGEIGGDEEEKAARYIRNHMTKKVVAFISGKTAPKGKRMGHAGAIISGSSGTAESKIQTFLENGVSVAELIHDIPSMLAHKDK